MAFSTRDLPNVNALWASLLVEELCRQGVGLFVVAPGSRSTPLAVAVARAVAEGKTTWLVHPDERACAFVALGWGRATGRPAAVVTTSGTAVANLLPAAVEADAAGVPLLLLTADRPPELRETGANQTIRQPALFQTVARWAFDAPVPSVALDPAVILTTAAHAFARTLVPAGPVHLNLPFREPLGAEPDGTDAEALLAPLARWVQTDLPYTHTKVHSDPEGWLFGVNELAGRLEKTERGLVVLGPTDDEDLAAAAIELADRLGWPLLPDVVSQARLGAKSGAAAHYDVALASARFAEIHRPEAVLHIGGCPLSKRLLALIATARPDLYVVVRSGPERFDPGHVVTDRVVADPGAWCFALIAALPQMPRPSEWRRSWQRAAAVAEAAAVSEIGRRLNEPFVARTVACLAPVLCVAASMPIRDIEMFAPAEGRQTFVTANRGASGIDGTVATAHGVARAFASPNISRPVVLLIGDLALLHDQTSLMLLRDGPQAGPPVVVVVVNNDGGGIFHFLPVARGASPLPADVFEAAMAAPHGLRFEHAAAQFGLAYHAPATADAFEAALAEALASGASALIEVTTDRAANEALHARITRVAAAAVDTALGL